VTPRSLTSVSSSVAAIRARKPLMETRFLRSCLSACLALGSTNTFAEPARSRINVTSASATTTRITAAASAIMTIAAATTISAVC